MTVQELANPTPSVEADVLVEICEAVWSSFIDPETPLDGPVDVDPSGWTRDGVAAEVTINGAWSGVLSVVLTQEGAAEVAGRMFEIEPGEVSEDDLSDAVGEIANMLGGNVKAMLEGEHSLGLPVVRALPEGLLAAAHEGTVAVATLLWGRHLVLVRLDCTPGDSP